MTDQPTPTTPGQRLAAARHAAGLSQPALAEQLWGNAKRQPNIVEWEADRVVISWPSAKKLAAVLGVTATWLMEGGQ